MRWNQNQLEALLESMCFIPTPDSRDVMNIPLCAVWEILNPCRRPADQRVHFHDHMFIATYVDCLWCTDRAETQVTEQAIGGTATIFLMAFLDDASRFIMNRRLRPDK
jgi:hypothetical protein